MGQVIGPWPWKAFRPCPWAAEPERTGLRIRLAVHAGDRVLLRPRQGTSGTGSLLSVDQNARAVAAYTETMQVGYADGRSAVRSMSSVMTEGRPPCLSLRAAVTSAPGTAPSGSSPAAWWRDDVQRQSRCRRDSFCAERSLLPRSDCRSASDPPNGPGWGTFPRAHHSLLRPGESLLRCQGLKGAIRAWVDQSFMPVGEPHKAGRLAFRPTDLDDLTYALTGTAAEVDLVTDGCKHSQLSSRQLPAPLCLPQGGRSS